VRNFPRVFLFFGVTSTIAARLHDLALAQVSLALCALIFFFSCFWLKPRINAAKDSKQI